VAPWPDPALTPASSTPFEEHPIALQLRYLPTLTEISPEKNSTTIFLVPIDLIAPFLENLRKKTQVRMCPPLGADNPEERIGTVQ
jgi:hypothetical protein